MLTGRHARVALLGLLVGAILLFWLSGGSDRLNLATLKQESATLQALIAGRPVLSALLFGLAYALAVAASIPGAAILTLAAGALFGLVTGVIVVSLASTIGATLAMLAARFIARDWVRSRFPDAVDRIDRGIARDGDAYLLSLRLAPVFPFFLINLAMGLTAMAPLRFALLTMIGAFPGTVAYIWAGTALAGIDSLSSILSPQLLGAFLALALLPLFGKWAARRIGSRRARRRFTRPRKFDCDMIVIGAGSGGLVAALVGAQLNAKVVLVERGEMGGDCLNTGCVPSKSLIQSSRTAATIRDSGRFGIETAGLSIDFQAVMRRVGEAIATIAPNDSVERYTAMGVDVRKASARLVDPWTVQLDDGQRLSARSIVVATGAEPIAPPIRGLGDSGFVTSDSIWDRLAGLDNPPDRIVIVGGGPIGCELGQALVRLGSAVSIVTNADRLLGREDADVSKLVRTAMESDGVRIFAGQEAVAVEDGSLVLDDGRRLGFDLLVVAAGRKPRLAGLGLEEIGIDCGQPLVRQSREPWRHIRFVGDAAGGAQFTHFAGHGGAIAALNAIGAPLARFDTDRLIPRVTFTDPEIASVGLTQGDASAAGRATETVTYDLAELDRAIVDGARSGLIKVLVKAGSDRILGVTIASPHAGDMILPWILAIKKGLGLKAMLSAIHPYPTYSEAGRAVAGVWRKAHRPQWALDLLGRWLEWRRG